jgi:hypothetical protein
MFKKKFLAIITLACLVLIPSCNLPGGQAPLSLTTQQATIPIETLVAEKLAATAAVQTALANAVASTLAALATNTPEYTFTPSLTSTPSQTPTLTITLTPSVPKASVSVETNCRSGPGLVYGILGVVSVGQSAEVVGKGAGDYWIIKVPSNPSVTCWLWGQYATVAGNTSGLPVFSPPPTPTPAQNFTVSFVDNTNCGSQYAFQFQVNNTGGITWESINIIITNNTADTTTTHTLDSFRAYEGCPLQSDQLNLEPGEGGLVSNINPGQLNYDPSGDHFTATFKLCSQNGLAGTCLEKTITFNP